MKTRIFLAITETCYWITVIGLIFIIPHYIAISPVSSGALLRACVLLGELNLLIFLKRKFFDKTKQQFLGGK